MDSGNKNNIERDNDNIAPDLYLLIKILWKKKKLIIYVVAIFMALGIIAALITPEEYSAQVVVIPQLQDKGISGSLSSLAAIAGASFDNFRGIESIQPKTYPIILNNVELLKELIYTPIKFIEYDKPMKIIDYYMVKENKNSKNGKMPYNSELQNSEYSVTQNKFSESDIHNLTENEERCIEIIKKKLSLNVNIKDGHVTLIARMPEAEAAAQVAQRSFFLLQKYLTAFKIERAEAQYDYVKQRYEEAKINYNDKQKEYTEFADANRSFSNAVGRAKEEHLRNEYLLASSIFDALAKQLIQAEMKVKEETPVLTVVEPVFVPHKRIKPNRKNIVMAYTLLGGIVGCCVGLTPYYYKNIKEKIRNTD